MYPRISHILTFNKHWPEVQPSPLATANISFAAKDAYLFVLKLPLSAKIVPLRKRSDFYDQSFKIRAARRISHQR